MVLQKRGLGEVIIKYRGIFDLNGLLDLVYDWLTHQNFEIHDKEYKHKVPDPRGAEEEITLICHTKVNPYVRDYIKVYFHLWEMKEVDVVKDGVKKKMMSAKLKLVLMPSIELDYTNRFSGNKFIVGLQDFYHKFIIKQDINSLWEDEFYYRVYKLHRMVKEFLGMESSTNAMEGRW